MSPALGWGLALAALPAGWFAYGWRGVALAVTLVMFWLLLQFNRSVRVMRDAAESPVGRVPNAVMLHAKLRAGLPMLQVVKLTRSLGKRLEAPSETWAWHDAAGAEVRIVFDANGRCARWELIRPPAPADPA